MSSSLAIYRLQTDILNFIKYIYIYIYIYIIFNWLIGLVGRVFSNGLGDQGSVPGHVLPKIYKMVLDTFLLNTQHYKVHIQGKLECPLLHLGVIAIEKGTFRSPTYFTYIEYLQQIVSWLKSFSMS